jgi:hypothetical protein
MAGKTFTSFAASIVEADAVAIAGRVPGPQSVPEKLGQVAAGLLKDLAKGGVMIQPEWAARIESAIGTTEPASIAEHVEKAVGRQGEAYVVPWVVDPTQIAFYRQLAEANGISLAHELKTMMDHAYAQGWFGMSAPEPFKLLVAPEQYRALQQMFGKDIVTGADVMERLQGEITAAEDDLVLDALAGGN